MLGEEEEQNCILSQNGDYFTIAKRLELLLIDILNGEYSKWQKVIRNARRVARYTRCKSFPSTANPKGGQFLRISLGVEDDDPRIDLLPRERNSIKNCSVHNRRTYAELI